MEGRPALPLADAFQVDRPIESAADNLYLATASPVADERNKPMLKRFYNLIPLMKGSDFDYIVFDLPPFTPTSPSLGLAGFMDRTVLVVEADKDRQDTLKRVYSELTERRSNVSLVLNKAESYLPRWAA
jgi:Mrp family chromosome partitioning ATPase